MSYNSRYGSSADFVNQLALFDNLRAHIIRMAGPLYGVKPVPNQVFEVYIGTVKENDPSWYQGGDRSPRRFTHYQASLIAYSDLSVASTFTLLARSRAMRTRLDAMEDLYFKMENKLGDLTQDLHIGNEVHHTSVEPARPTIQVGPVNYDNDYDNNYEVAAVNDNNN